MSFAQFWSAYEAIVHEARQGALTAEDFSGDGLADQPGHARHEPLGPRLMPGQGTMIGVRAMEYPAELQGASEERLSMCTAPAKARCRHDGSPRR